MAPWFQPRIPRPVCAPYVLDVLENRPGEDHVHGLPLENPGVVPRNLVANRGVGPIGIANRAPDSLDARVVEGALQAAVIVDVGREIVALKTRLDLGELVIVGK